MKELFKGMRIFREERLGEEERFLILNEKNIGNYIFLTDTYLVKKGDVLTPHKWLRYDRDFLPKETFNPNEYEYYLIDCLVHFRKLRAAVKPFIHDSQDLFNIKTALPLEAEVPLRAALEEAGTFEEIDFENVELYRSSLLDHEPLMVTSDSYLEDDITEEVTSKLFKEKITKVYKRAEKNRVEYLFKTDYYYSDVEGYLYYKDEINDFYVMKQFNYEDKDFLFSDFKEIEFNELLMIKA